MKNRKEITGHWFHIVGISFLFLSSAPSSYAEHPSSTPAPRILNHTELELLSRTAAPDGPLLTKLTGVLSEAVVNNDATASGVVPKRPVSDALGPLLRLGSWNIGQRDPLRVIQWSPEEEHLLSEATSTHGADQVDRLEALRQMRVLQDADVLVLNEVDSGVPRSGYQDVAANMARTLQMNYAYGVEFVEIDPTIFDQQLDERFRGFHGNAILSRYPIKTARIVRLPECHDWYGREIEKVAKLESGRRWAASYVFKERTTQQVRHGGRMMLIADIEVPDLPTAEVTVVAIHLENRTEPECRRQQMAAALAEIRAVRNPVIVAGDLNTMGVDGTPTSVRREIVNRVSSPRFWLSQAIAQFNPSQIARYGALAINYFKNYKDPTAKNVPLLAPNSESAFFRTIENFRFDDGKAFDFRGSATLGNSNKRSWKGFKATFRFGRKYYGFAEYKLDWILVKPFILHPRQKNQSVRMAPHNPEVMAELSWTIGDGESDHYPLTVDMPLQDIEIR
jgi:endonuclease/exonuclease/phosphatase family metal-dependent hydrolase